MTSLPLVLIWHHHQPLYRDLTAADARGSYRKPWVRLHALRDYYGMAALVAAHPRVHVTFNFSGCLLWQIEDYARHGASDQELELTLKAPEAMSARERETVLATFFDAESETQILPHRRYRELFEANQAGRTFSAEELRDLQMWFNLAWFGRELRERPVTLATGETLDVARFLDKERGFDQDDIAAMVAEQRKLLRAIIPLHRRLQDEGRIEVAVSAFYHPILPLLIDTDRATLDRPGTTLPRTFRHPEDAAAQIHLAVQAHQRHFGRPPRGTWPPEGAVSQSIIPFLARAGLRWMATDQAVLGRSGRWGYRDDLPAVRQRVYRAQEDTDAIAVFFRDRELSDDISFRCHADPDPAHAARAWREKLAARAVSVEPGAEARAATVVLDGENAWGAYRDDGRPFLQALYQALDEEGATTTPSALLDRAEAPLERVHDLFTASWIDEPGSGAGVDLGTWIGEPEENQAWDLLGAARDALTSSGATFETLPTAYHALYAAEGSDWFWWYGDDQESGQDASFDELFRAHLRACYQALGAAAPAALSQAIVLPEVLWTAARPLRNARVGDRFTVRVHCPGTLTWAFPGEAARAEPLQRAGGALAGAGWYQTTIGPFAGEGVLEFTVRCTRTGCDCQGTCCRGPAHVLRVWGRSAPA